MAKINVEYDFDWNGADRELQQAFALGPRDSFGAEIATELAGALGHWDEGRQLGIEAIALDPLNAEAHNTLGYVIYLNSGHLAEAEQSFRRVLQITPEYDVNHYLLGEALMLQGRLETALAEFRKATPDDGQAVGSAMAYFAAGRNAESDAQLAEAIRQQKNAPRCGCSGNVLHFTGVSPMYCLDFVRRATPRHCVTMLHASSRRSG